jgi:hypothetical protein
MGDLEVKSGKPVEIKVGKMWNDEFNLKLLIIKYLIIIIN